MSEPETIGGRVSGDRARKTIARLVSGLEPVRPIRFRSLLLLCLVGAVLAAAVGLLAMGVRADLLERLHDPVFVVIVAILALASAVCAAAAIRAAVPGREPRRTGIWLLWMLPVLLAAAVAITAPWGSTWPGWSRLLLGCWSCVSLTFFAALAPWTITLAVVSRLAPLRRVRAGLLAGLAAFLLGALVTELHCPLSDGYHLAFAHYLPVGIFASLTCLAAAWLVPDPGWRLSG